MLNSDRLGRHLDEADALGSLNPLLILLYMSAVACVACALLGFR